MFGKVIGRGGIAHDKHRGFARIGEIIGKRLYVRRKWVIFFHDNHPLFAHKRITYERGNQFVGIALYVLSVKISQIEFGLRKAFVAYEFYGMSHEKSVVARDEINPFNAVYKTSFKFLEFHNQYFNIFDEKNQEFKRRFVKSYIVAR